MTIDDPRVQAEAQFEGCVDHFYLDTKGIVTIAIGAQVFDPMLLQMVVGDRPATHDEIMADYESVRRMMPGMLAGEYRAVTTCRMTDDQILALFEDRWNHTQSELESRLGPIGGLPLPAQMGIMDMSFNMGVGRLFEPPPHGFPHFIAAFKAQDWATCAKECQREDVQQSRNDWTVQQFKSLMEAA